MNCHDIQRYCLERVGTPLGASVEAHLASCADCRRVYERAVAVRNLLGLKRYEQPDAHLETRLLATVRSRIEQGEGRAVGLLGRLAELLASEPLPALRYGLAAVAVALVGANVLLLNHLPSLQSDEAAAPAVAAVAPEPVLELAATNDSALPYAKPVFVFEYPSNRQPNRPLNIGPGSVPVKYSY